MLYIGYTRRNYVAERVIQGAWHPDIEFRRVPHLSLRRLARRPFWRHATGYLATGRADLVHLSHEVGWGDRPFVATFEDEVPVGRRRSPRAGDAGLRRLASRRCRAVLMMSEDARRRFEADTRAYAPLAEKCMVCGPCVPGADAAHARFLARQVERARTGRRGPLQVLFVGVQFFRKGGDFVLDALEPLAAGSEPGVRLTIVSPFEPDGYVTPADGARVKAVKRRVASLPWVRRVDYVDPVVLRETMATSDLLALPTLDETFGFVLVEALATGLPVATTSVRAIPEILPVGEHAFAVDLRTGPDGGWEGIRLWRTAGDVAYARAWEDARERCVEGIRRRVAAVLAEGGASAPLARARRAHYEARFTPEVVGDRLEAIYRRALGG